MLDDRFVLYPLSQDESATCEVIAAQDACKLTVMPNHHINDLGDFMGFRYECDPYDFASTLPLIRTMFHGTTMIQCDVPEKDILNLMMNSQECGEKMRDFLSKVDSECIPATLDCIPENTSSITEIGMLNATGLKTVDSKHWTPEVPDRIGVYHAYMRGYNRDVRSHKLFLVCSGGLNRACDDFCNLVIDTGTKCNAENVYLSEEVWWLRKACQRARCQLLKGLADAMGIPIQYMEDIQSYKTAYMAIPTTDTIENDIQKMGNGKVVVYNQCMDTTKNFNGILCNMHPSEGVWLFKGSHKVTTFGSMFGDQQICGVFPVNAPQGKVNSAICLPDASFVCRLTSRAKKESYMCFDEAYFKVLESMQWNRDNGYEALIPIVVGIP